MGSELRCDIWPRARRGDGRAARCVRACAYVRARAHASKTKVEPQLKRPDTERRQQATR